MAESRPLVLVNRIPVPVRRRASDDDLRVGDLRACSGFVWDTAAPCEEHYGQEYRWGQLLAKKRRAISHHSGGTPLHNAGYVRSISYTNPHLPECTGSAVMLAGRVGQWRQSTSGAHGCLGLVVRLGKDL